MDRFYTFSHFRGAVTISICGWWTQLMIIIVGMTPLNKMSTEQVLRWTNGIAAFWIFCPDLQTCVEGCEWSSSPEESPQGSPQMTLLFLTHQQTSGASSGKAASCDWSADWSRANLNPHNFLVTPSNAAVTQLYTPRCCCSVRSIASTVNAGLLLLCLLTPTLLLGAYTYFAIPPSSQQVPVGFICTLSCYM